MNPVLEVTPVGAEIPLFTTHTLYCGARGFPPPNIIWYRNNSVINVAADTSVDVKMDNINLVSVRSNLIILNATFDDSGVYCCQANPNNSMGMYVKSMAVNVTVVCELLLNDGHVLCIKCYYIK